MADSRFGSRILPPRCWCVVAVCLALGHSIGAAQTADDFAGVWVNVNPKTGGMSRIVLSSAAGGTEMVVHGFGACVPDDCDWGEIRAPFTGNPGCRLRVRVRDRVDEHLPRAPGIPVHP